MPKTDRRVLNEKPIYLTSYLLILAVVQANFHLCHDYDRIDTQGTKNGEGAPSTQNSHAAVPAYLRLQSKIGVLVLRAGFRVVVVAMLAPIVYSLPIGIYPYSIRIFSWRSTRLWAKLFYTLPHATSPPGIGPFHLMLLLRTLISGFMLVMLWEVGNEAFSAYVAQEPLKNERPITFESRDPNGSLLTGLKGQKIQTRVRDFTIVLIRHANYTKAFAFWELAYISQRFEGRRKAIFEDIDRKGGSMWSQILSICLETIGEMATRIDNYENPPAPQTNASTHDEIKSLPRLTEPLKSGLGGSDDLFSSPSRKASGFEAKLFSRDKTSTNNLSPRVKQLASKAESAVLTPEQRQTVTSGGYVGLLRQPFLQLLQYRIGQPFRQEYRRKMAAVVLGQPYGDVGIIVDAVDSLTRFAVCSLTEDKFGNVQRDVKLIIRTFTTAVTKLEQFRDNVGFHWTDVEQRRESPEVDTILAALKGGLDELVAAFGDYSEDLRLSQSEMRMAREAAATPAKSRTEMGQKGR